MKKNFIASKRWLYRAFTTLSLDHQYTSKCMIEKRWNKTAATSDRIFISTRTINRVAATGYFQEATMHPY